MHLRPLRNLLFTLTLPLATIGCGDAAPPVGPGTVQVAWQVLPHGCAVGGVAVVDAALYNDRGAAPVTSARAECEAAPLVLEAPAGRYTLIVDGERADGARIVAAPAQEVVIRPGVEERLDAPVEISGVPGSVRVRWRFADGRVCGAHGATHVDVRLFDPSDLEVARQTFACNTGEGSLPEIPAGAYTVWARTVVEGEGAAAQTGTGQVKAQRGAALTTEVVIGRAHEGDDD